MVFISKTWRLFATAFCFAVFGLSGLVMAIFWLPVYRLLYKDERKRQKAGRYSVHIGFKLFVWLMEVVGVLKVDVQGLSKLKKVKGKIVIANHPSLIDVVLLISLIPNANCVVKQQLWRNIFTRGVLRTSGYLSNLDPEALITDCKASLLSGSNLIIFPEGTRTQPGQVVKFRRGAANIALRSGINFQRTIIQIMPPALTKGLPWYKVPKTKMFMTLDVLEEFDISEYSRESLSLSVRKLTRDIENVYLDDLANLKIQQNRQKQ